MPVVQISVPAGSLTDEQKQLMISGITDVVVDVEGFPQVRRGTFVLINEVPDGGWGMAGTAWTLEGFAAQLGGGASDGAAAG